MIPIPLLVTILIGLEIIEVIIISKLCDWSLSLKEK